MPGVRLSLEEREEISRGLVMGCSLRSIAAGLGRPPSTVAREVARCGGRSGYRAVRAQRAAVLRCRRPKPTKLEQDRWLARWVAGRLARRWSPVQIAARLRREFPHDPQWWVSPESIYQSLYVQGRGGLRRELSVYLRQGHTRRVHRSSVHRKGGQLRDMVLLADRPPEADDRRVPGYWEGDLMMGAAGRSAIGILVERTSRYVLLFALPHGRHPALVRDAITAKIRRLPTELVRALTWDRGKEMAQHATFTIDTGVQVYFCDPRSPWQRGTAENTVGLLRQYFPRGTELVATQAELNRVARELNSRPRQTLEWMTPSERFAQLVATIT